MSAACSDLPTGHRLVRGVNTQQAGSSVLTQGVIAMGEMWSRRYKASLRQAFLSYGGKCSMVWDGHFFFFLHYMFFLFILFFFFRNRI